MIFVEGDLKEIQRSDVNCAAS